MKERNGFVSNSSSCSFVCDFCGRHREGWDWDCMENYGFTRCPNGHVVCESHCENTKGESITEGQCPICSDSYFGEDAWAVRTFISSNDCKKRDNEGYCEITSDLCTHINCPRRSR